MSAEVEQQSEQHNAAALPTPAASSPSLAAGISSALRKAFSFPALLGALLVGSVTLATRASLPDPDMWWHLAAGKRILSTHTWPASDPFSFTVHGQYWIPYEWFGEVLMAWVERWAGLEGLAVLLALLSGVLALLVYYYATLRSQNCKAAFIAAFFILNLATGFFTVRPQMLGYIFLTLLLICLEKYHQGHLNTLWILPVIFLIWVNSHATFTLGLFALGIFWATGLVNVQHGGLESRPWTQKQSCHLLLILLACVAALALTPYGTSLAAYPFWALISQPLNLAHVAEWRPIGFGEAWGMQVLLLLLAFLLAQLIFRMNYRLYEVVLFLTATYLACVHRRFFPSLAIIIVPLAALLLARWFPAYSAAKDHPVLNAVLIGAIILTLVKLFPSRQDLDGLIQSVYPASALDYLQNHPQPGPMFNEYLWGGYMIWKLGPKQKVFIDGRTDIYEYAGVFADYLGMTSLDPKTLFMLRKYGIRSCLLTHDDPLGTLLSNSPGWRRVYKDNVCVIYSQQAGATQPNITTRIETPAASRVRFTAAVWKPALAEVTAR